MTDLNDRLVLLCCANSSSSFRFQFISPLWFLQFLLPSPTQQVRNFPTGSLALFSVLPKPLTQASVLASVMLYSSSSAFVIDGGLLSFFFFFTPSAFSIVSYELNFCHSLTKSLSRWLSRVCHVLDSAGEIPCCKTEVLS